MSTVSERSYLGGTHKASNSAPILPLRVLADLVRWVHGDGGRLCHVHNVRYAQLIQSVRAQRSGSRAKRFITR